VSLARPFDDPLPAEAGALDAITFLFFYHDTSYMAVDRDSVGKTLHRIEEGALRREAEAAGFKFIAQGDFWRHPEDTRDFSTQPPPGRPVDEFVLKFQKSM
jgi:predicted methyltransferase